MTRFAFLCTTTTRHEITSWKFFNLSNADAALKILTLANSPTMTRTGLINGNQVWILCTVVDLPQALATIQNAIILLFSGSLPVVVANVNRTRVFSEKWSGHIYVRKMQFHRLYDMGVLHASRKSVTAPPPKRTLEDYKTVTPNKWPRLLTRGVVHKRFHQQGFD